MENKFTNRNTVDEAWGMMRTTLDKEMPVQKKRRAIGWILFGLGMLALVILVYVFALHDVNVDAQPKEQIQTTVESKPIASKETKFPSTTINRKENSSKLGGKSIKNTGLSAKSDLNPWLNRNNKASSKTKFIASMKSIVPNSQSTNQNMMASNQIQTIVTTEVFKKKDREVQLRDQSLTPSNPISMASDVLDNASPAQDLVTDSRPISKLVDPLPILNNSQFDWESNTDLGIPAPKLRKWNLGFKTAVLSDVKIDSPTLLAEGQVWRKMGSRWSFVSGLGLKSQNLQFDYEVEGNSAATQDLISDPAGISIFGIDLASQNTSLTESSSSALNSRGKRSYAFNFLYIPIGVKYDFKGRWSLDAGLHYNFLELSGGDSNNNSLKYDTQFGDNRNSSEAASSIRDFTRRNFNHFSYYLSLNYKLGKRASLLVQYQGNTNRFVGDNPKIDAHQLGVGMYWQF